MNFKEKWHHVKRKPEDIRSPKITSDIYLQFSAISDDIKKHAYLAKGKLLDVGAGMSPYKPFFKKYVKEYITLDSYDYEGIKPNIISEGENIPLPDKSIDTVLCTQVLEHIPYPQKMIDEIYRILKPNSICILTTHMANPLHGLPHDYYRFTRICFEKVLFKKFKKVIVKENGGALLSIFQFINWGLTDIFPKFIAMPFIILINIIIKPLDKVFFNPMFTTNYIVMATK